MRYVSDLRVGRVNPQHFKFGLDVGPRRYDLTEFLRNEVVYSQDVLRWRLTGLNRVLQGTGGSKPHSTAI